LWASTNARAMAQAVMGTSNIVSCNLSLSADGAYVAFEVITNSNAFVLSGMVLRHNVPSGVTDLIASNANVSAGPFEAIRSLDMTGDGRFIALVANLGNPLPLTNSAIYRWDAQTGTNVLVSADQTTGQPAIGLCSSPALSADGRYVAFISSGTNLVTNAISGDYHAYVRDTQSGTTVLADAGLDGTGAGVGAMIYPALSADGQSLAFETYQPNLVATDQNSNDDVFVFTPGTIGLERISANEPTLFGSGPTISWQTNGLETCQMRFTSDLSDTNWQDAMGSITIMGKQAHFTDLAPAPAQRFYRVVAY
jgi:Tol biopolymer transport system component